jgi:hypothetical protein
VLDLLDSPCGNLGWGQTPLVGDLATDLRQPPRLGTDPLLLCLGIPKVCYRGKGQTPVGVVDSLVVGS